MSEQYVYRYNDVNRVGDGHAQVQLLRVKQTPDTVECGAGPVLSEYNWTEI